MNTAIYFNVKKDGTYEVRCKTIKDAERALETLKSVHGSNMVDFTIRLETFI